MADTPRRGIDPVDSEAPRRRPGDEIFRVGLRVLLAVAALVVLWYAVQWLVVLTQGPIGD